MPKIDHLVEFVAVVDAGSISAASRVLGVPRATLSRRLTALEEELQVKLIHRETRKLGLTHAGELLMEQARAVVSSAEEAWRAVRQVQDVPRGRLRVSMPPAHLFSDLLAGFGRAFPQIETHVIGTPHMVDLVAEGVDVALRTGLPHTLGTGLISRKLWSEDTQLVASPAYLDGRGRPTEVEHLTGHDCIVGFGEGWQPSPQFPLHDGGMVRVQSRFVTRDPFTRLVVALQGGGIALLGSGMTSAYVESGQLEPLLVGVVGSTRLTSLVFPERKYLPSRVRAFIDFTVDFYEADPYPGGHRVQPSLFPPVIPPSD